MNMSSNLTTQNRYLGWDLVKFFSFIAIIIFHFQWIVWYTYDVPEYILNYWYGAALRIPTEFYARLLSFSGFTIVFMAGLNQGQTAKNLAYNRNLFLFLLMGWIVFSLLIFGVDNFHLAWDVYPLLFVGLLSANVLQGSSELNRRMIGIFGFIMLFVPFWVFESNFADQFELQHILVGNCEKDFADWPVLPWIGLIWFGYFCGGELRRLRQSNKYFFKLKKLELTVWLILLGLSTHYFGAFYNVNLGEGFACAIFRFPWFIFWSHFIWPIFALRISLDLRVQKFIQSRKILMWIVSLRMVRKFWLAYIIHFAYIQLLGLIIDIVQPDHSSIGFSVLALVYVTLFPLIEVMTRISDHAIGFLRKE